MDKESGRVTVRDVLDYLASSRFTLHLFPCVLVALLAYYEGLDYGREAFVIALGAMLCNLVFAVVRRPVFRTDTPLLVFHLALATLVLLLLFGRLVYYEGQTELVEGQTFEGDMVSEEAGLLHDQEFHRASFTNEAFVVHYLPNVVRQDTRNRVTWIDEKGQSRESIIGDTEPLVIEGYSVYTTWNKGFAVLFTWYPAEGGEITGAVNMPSYPAHRETQIEAWKPPGTDINVWTTLVIEENLVRENESFVLDVPGRHHILVRYRGEEFKLRMGDHVRLDAGILQYRGLRKWMGYRVSYDPALPWVLASALFAIIALLWHFLRRNAILSGRQAELPEGRLSFR